MEALLVVTVQRECQEEEVVGVEKQMMMMNGHFCSKLKRIELKQPSPVHTTTSTVCCMIFDLLSMHTDYN
jgi:hypothetical protein